MKQYLYLAEKILTSGVLERNRTGIGAYTIPFASIEFDMSEGTYPILNTRKLNFEIASKETEFFIKGMTDKRWLQHNGVWIWDEWANPAVMEEKYGRKWRSSDYVEREQFTKEEVELFFNKAVEEYHNRFIAEFENQGHKIPPKAVRRFEELQKYFTKSDRQYSLDVPIDKLPIKRLQVFGQMLEGNLGPIYGWLWNHWGAEYHGPGVDYSGQGVNQLENLINTLMLDHDTLRENPEYRRMLVSSWEPNYKELQALPACHYEFHAVVVGDKLNVEWTQRSVDVAKGLPFNLAGYGLILHLLSQLCGYKPGILKGDLRNVHIYGNDVDEMKEQLKRDPDKCPKPMLKTVPFKSIHDWKHSDTSLIGYQPYPAIKFGEVAV